MAVDETILHAAARDQLSTLRFYSWQPATLSLGYFQRLADRQSHPASKQCVAVRRLSGGGAIVHDHELTYCFATPARDRLSDNKDLYLAFHQTLLEALAERGVVATLHPGGRESGDQAFLCFQRRSNGDVIVGTHKIAGSAQRRRQNAIVQHGSVLLQRSPYAPELPGLADLTDFEATGLQEAWLQHLATRLDFEFLPGRLSDNEQRTAAQLAQEKFSNDRWNGRR